MIKTEGVYVSDFGKIGKRYGDRHLNTPTVRINTDGHILRIAASEERFNASIGIESSHSLSPIDATISTSQFAKACRFLFHPDSAFPYGEIHDMGHSVVISNLAHDTHVAIRKHGEETIASSEDRSPIVRIPSMDFHRIIRSVCFAAQTEPDHLLRLELGRVYFQAGNDMLQITATDAFRYSRYELPLPSEDSTPNIAFGVYKDELVRAERFVAGKSRRGKTTLVGATDTHLILDEPADGVTAYIPFKNMHAGFLDALGKIDKYLGPGKSLVFDAQELKNRFGMFKRGRVVTLSVAENDDGTSLQIDQTIETVQGKRGMQEVLSHTMKTKVEAHGDFPNSVALRSKHLNELLTHSVSCGRMQLEIKVINSKSPVVFKYPDDDSFVHLIMPMHL